jgi:uncharacterized protein YjiS (DUF1127 family)
MTVQTYSHHHEPGVLSRVWDWLAHLGQAYVEAREMQARYEALSSLSDHQLADIGLTRSDVPRAALGKRSML